MEEISTIISLISAIITFILVIMFLIIAINVSKIKKLILRSQGIFIAWAKKEGITKEKECPGCKIKFEIPFNQPKGYLRCPECGYNNYIDSTN